MVGLGPGGSSASRVCAEAGLNVIGIDKKKSFGFPVQCAEFIPLPMASYARDEPVRIQRITGMKSFLPSGEVEFTDFRGLMIDRQEFDQALAQSAIQSGARLYSSAHLLSLRRDAKRAEAIIDREVVEIHFQYVVAADGPHSHVAHQLGLPSLKTVNTRQYTVDLLEPLDDTDIWLSDEFPGGYAWLFPKGDRANLGLGIDKRWGVDLKAALDNLHEKLVAQGRIGKSIHARTGGAIPVGGMREKLVCDEILFVGDAAGLTHPITGAGIAAAVVSGEHAAQAIVEKIEGNEDAFEEYDEEMREQYGPGLERAVAKRLWLEGQWHTQAAQQDEIMRAGWIAFHEYQNAPGAKRVKEMML